MTGDRLQAIVGGLKRDGIDLKGYPAALAYNQMVSKREELCRGC